MNKVFAWISVGLAVLLLVCGLLGCRTVESSQDLPVVADGDHSVRDARPAGRTGCLLGL